MRSKRYISCFLGKTTTSIKTAPFQSFILQHKTPSCKSGLKKANRLATKTVAVDSSNKKLTASNMRLYIFLKYDMFTYSNFCLQLKQGRK